MKLIVRWLLMRYYRALYNGFETMTEHAAILSAQVDRLSDEIEALQAANAEQNILIGQLMYDDPEFDGEQDMLVEINKVKAMAAETAQAELAKHSGGKDFGQMAVCGARGPLFYFVYTDKEQA